MIQRDYIVRQVMQLSQAIAQAIFRIQKQEYQEALDELQQSGQQFMGLDVSDVTALEVDALKLQAGEHLDLVAELFHLQGHCFRAEGYQEAAHRSYELALACYLDSPKSQADLIDPLIEELNITALAPDTQRAVFRYLEGERRYGEAEDLLFEMVEQGLPVYEEGLAFYKRLLGTSYKPLREGNLPWDEVKEGLAAFKAKFSAR